MAHRKCRCRTARGGRVRSQGRQLGRAVAVYPRLSVSDLSLMSDLTDQKRDASIDVGYEAMPMR